MLERLSIWIFPDIIALVICAATMRHLWKLRGEAGVASLFIMSALVALWAILDLAMILSGSRPLSLSLARSIYLPEAGLVAAWLTFAMSYTGQRHLMGSWPALMVLGLASVPLFLIMAGDPGGWLVAGGGMAAGSFGFLPSFGNWHPIHQGYTWGIGVFATGVLTLHVGQSPRHVNRLIFVLGGPAVGAVSYALVPIFPTLPEWLNLPPLGLSLTAAAFAFGLLRSEEDAMAPVARHVVVEEMEDAVIVLDRRGRVIDVNRSAANRLKLGLMKPLPIELKILVDSLMEQSTAPGRGILAERVKLEVEQGRVANFEARITKLGPQAGQNRIVMVLRDIEAQLQLEQRLEAMTLASQHRAHTDELTGLPNRRALMRRLEEEVERAHRYGRYLSLIILDLDHFKSVNDTHGHSTGDQVLVATADAMEAVCRDQDMAGRMGGEEFAIILPETDQSGAHSLADRVRLQIGRRTYEAPGGSGSFRVTASLGVATLEPGAVATVKALIQSADEALYKAKHQGRNRVSLAG